MGGSASGRRKESGKGKKQNARWKGGAVEEVAMVSLGRESCQSVRPPSHDLTSAETLGEVNKDEWMQSRIFHFSPQVSDAGAPVMLSGIGLNSSLRLAGAKAFNISFKPSSFDGVGDAPLSPAHKRPWKPIFDAG